MNSTKLFKAFLYRYSGVLNQRKGNVSRRDFFLHPKNPLLYGFFGFKNKSLRETFPFFHFKTLLQLLIKAMKSLVEFIQVQLFY